MSTTSDTADRIRFGQRLTMLRNQCGFTQEVLAARIGISVVTLGYYEQGKRSPSFGMLRRLAKGLRVPREELFRGL